MAAYLPDSVGLAWANAVIAAIDAGGAAGSSSMISGPRPAGGGALTGSNTVLYTGALSYPCGSASVRSFTITAPAAGAATAAGTPSFIRHKTSTGTVAMDVDCIMSSTWAAMSADEKKLFGLCYTLSTSTVDVGASVTIATLTVPEPNS